MNLAELDRKRVHFIGLGGAGMSGIARIMISRGINVSGSDAKDSPVLEGLRTLGATVFIGHHASNISNAEVLVYTSAISESNPELISAKEAGILI